MEKFGLLSYNIALDGSLVRNTFWGIGIKSFLPSIHKLTKIVVRVAWLKTFALVLLNGPVALFNMGRGMYPPQPTVYINNLNDKVKKEGQCALFEYDLAFSTWKVKYNLPA